MKKQKWASAALAVTILFGGVPMAVQAETGVTQGSLLNQAQAVETAATLFSISSDFKLESASQNTKYHGETDSVWVLSWEQEKFAERTMISVVLDARTGEPLEFTQYDSGLPPTGKPVTLEEARAKAKALIAKASPDKAGRVVESAVQGPQFTVNGQPNNDLYSFRFVREVNGVKVATDSFQLVYDKAGNLKAYSLDWSQDDAAFPKPEGVISAEQAQAKYQAGLPLRLQYQARYLPGVRTPELYLVYAASGDRIDYNLSDLPVLDAASGQVIASNGLPLEPPGKLAALTDKPGVAPSGKLADQDAAIAAAKRYVPGLDASYVLASSEEGMGGGESKEWRFRWEKNVTSGGKGGSDVFVSVDAATGELRSLSAWDRSEGQTPTLAWEQAKAKAVELVKTAVPTQTDRFALTTLQPEMDIETMKLMGDTVFRFEFSYLVNGLLSPEHAINVSINAATGAVEQFSIGNMPHADSEYVDPGKAVSEARAGELYAQKYPLELQYVRLFGRKNADGTELPARFALAYVPQGAGLLLDAVDGQWFNRNGTVADHKKIADIAGHWAAEPLQQLADMNIFNVDEQGKVRPEEAVTRGDAMRILVMFMAAKSAGSAKSESSYDDVLPGDPNYEFIETAVQLGWLPRDLKEFHPNDPMKRGELAKLLVSVQGYGDLSQKSNVFQKPFADLANDDPNLGSIAIAKALGLMSGDGPNFKPQSAVSRAEMAVVVTRLQQKQGGRLIY